MRCVIMCRWMAFLLVCQTAKRKLGRQRVKRGSCRRSKKMLVGRENGGGELALWLMEAPILRLRLWWMVVMDGRGEGETEIGDMDRW